MISMIQRYGKRRCFLLVCTAIVMNNLPKEIMKNNTKKWTRRKQYKCLRVWMKQTISIWMTIKKWSINLYKKRNNFSFRKYPKVIKNIQKKSTNNLFLPKIFSSIIIKEFSIWMRSYINLKINNNVSLIFPKKLLKKIFNGLTNMWNKIWKGKLKLEFHLARKKVKKKIILDINERNNELVKILQALRNKNASASSTAPNGLKKP